MNSHWRNLATAVGLLLVSGFLTACGEREKPVTRPFVLPEELRYERAKVPDDENAVLDWRKAAESKIDLDPTIHETVFGYWKAREWPDLDSSVTTAIQTAIQQNTRALGHLEDSLGKTNASFETISAVEPALSVLLELSQLRLFLVREHIEQQRWNEGVILLKGNIRLAEMVIQAEGPLIHYLIAHTIRSRIHGAILWLATRPNVPDAVLVDLQRQLPSLDSEPSDYVASLKVEFAHFGGKRSTPLESAKEWTENLGIDPDAGWMGDEELSRAFQIFLTPDLVAGHPAPLDQDAALTRTAQRFLTTIRNARSAWVDQEDVWEGVEGRREAFRTAAAQVLKAVQGKPLPLDSEAIAAARRPYNNLVDPMGTALSAAANSVPYSVRRVFEARTERQAVRAVLALKRFELLRGDLPDRLEELVEAALLESPPLDYFSGEPLRYDKSRGLLWSVGENGRDDGAKESALGDWKAEDVVWSIAPSSR